MRIVTLAAVCLTVLSLCTPARAEMLTVAWDIRPPWRMLDEGRPFGFDAALLEKAAEQLGLQLEYKVFPRKKALRLMKQGKIDLITGLGESKRLERYLEYVNPPYMTDQTAAFYALPRIAKVLNRYEQLRIWRIGVRRRDRHFPHFDQDNRILKAWYKTMGEGFTRLKRRAFGVLVAKESEGDWWMVHNPKSSRKIVKTQLKYTNYAPLHVAFAKKSPLADRASELGLIISNMIQDGTLAELKRRWGIENPY